MMTVVLHGDLFSAGSGGDGEGWWVRHVFVSQTIKRKAA